MWRGEQDDIYFAATSGGKRKKGQIWRYTPNYQAPVGSYPEGVLELYVECRGNLVRVWDELQAKKVEISYAALTAYCRREGIGQTDYFTHGNIADFRIGYCTVLDMTGLDAFTTISILARSAVRFVNMARTNLIRL